MDSMDMQPFLVINLLGAVFDQGAWCRGALHYMLIHLPLQSITNYPALLVHFSGTAGLVQYTSWWS